MRAVVEIRTMWIWIVVWTICDILISPTLIRWGWLGEHTTTRELLLGDSDVAFFVFCVWLVTSRKVPAVN
jgi:hypothetical protein